MQITYDFRPTARIAAALRAAGKNAPFILNRAINHTGDKALTQMRKVLVTQTGLKRKTINKAVTSTKAGGGSSYTIRTMGGNVRLKYFGAKETAAGVSAAPWGQRKVYPGTFIKGSRFPKRVALKMGGHVYKRKGSGRLPIEGGRSGLYIPDELITGESKAAFYSTLDAELPARLARELARFIG